MYRRTRIALLIPHLGGGGAERVIALLSENLSHEKYELHLCTVTHSPLAPSRIPAQIAFHCLDASRVRSAFLALFFYLRRTRPDLIISGMAHLNLLVLLMRPFLSKRMRVLVRQNGTLTAMLSSSRHPAFARQLFRFLYPTADKIICQSLSMANDLRSILDSAGARVEVLRNPLGANSIASFPAPSTCPYTGKGPHLLGVGRLSREKGFDLLLEALAILRDRFPSADLTLAGTEPEAIALRSQCQALGLSNFVRFLGHVDDPRSLYLGASLFVCPSRHEGVPNALLEAAAAGLPIVATPASGGVVELLSQAAGAWLTSEISAQALAQSLCTALESLSSNQRFVHSWIDPFRLENAIPAYERLIDATVAQAAS